jgi:2-polyprenyl-3-methyl-5-hydroxy-6-metoxy-1,4-benzoquinol methylase
MTALAVLVKKVLAPYRLKVIRRIMGDKALSVLDVGCGNQSCELTRYWLEVSAYHGVDKEFWNDKRDDYSRMDRLYTLDLELCEFEEIPDAKFDVIIMSHVIEHLTNGYSVIENLIPKLAEGGCMYVETPSHLTLNYPSAIGFLNFYDDPTHKRIYEPRRIVDLFMKQGLRILKCGYRRDWIRLIFLSPIALALNCVYYIPFRRKLFASGLWDLLGVASVVVARNSQPHKTIDK